MLAFQPKCCHLTICDDMTSTTQCPFDHAVITVRVRMDEAAAIYARMGFTLTERSYHAAGSCNHLMVFERDYLELIGFPPAGQAIRADLLESPIGLDDLVLKAGDTDGIHRELVARGFPAGAAQCRADACTTAGMRRRISYGIRRSALTEARRLHGDGHDQGARSCRRACPAAAGRILTCAARRSRRDRRVRGNELHGRVFGVAKCARPVCRNAISMVF